MRTVLVLVSCLSLATAAMAADKDAKPIVPSINDVIPTLPTVTVTSPAPYLKPLQLAPSDSAHAIETTPAWAAPWLPADLAAPISHAKSPHEIAADKAFDEEKDTFDTKERARVAEYVGKATEHPTTARSAGSATVYGYRESDIYIVYAGLDRLTDIELEAGESLTAEPVAGDTEGWIKSEFTSGSGASARTHIVVKPRDEGIETNLIVPTTKRVYHLNLRSKPDWYMPAVRWFYPDEDAAAIVKKDADDQARQDSSEALAVSPDKLNFRYRVKGRDLPWKPAQVFDDGAKVYLKMPESMASGDAPALFVIEDGKPLLVNYRVKDRLYIVDRLFANAQLRVGDRQIDVERCTAHSWFCH
jgi:P-type conjugative transfer protein TrbG